MVFHRAKLRFPQTFAADRCNKAAASGLAGDKALALKLLIRTLGRDNADAQLLRQQAHRRQRLPGLQLSAEDFRLDLTCDLLVDRRAVHIGYYDVHAIPPSFIVYTHYIQYEQYVKG